MFLHPAILILGAFAAALPLAIHWLTRPRPAKLPISTLRFVREVVRQRRAAHWLRDAVVLALRTLAVLLLAAAIARPLLSPGRQAESSAPAPATLRVVLVDLSQSLAAETSGVQALERGRPLAARQLEFRPGLRTNLILAAARPSAVFTGPSTNFSALREALAAAQVLPERLQVQPALNMAAEMLAAGPAAARRELVIVSDFQRTSWSAADFRTLPENTAVELLSVVPAAPPGNAAILHVVAAGRPQAGQEQRLEVEVGNFAPAARSVKVEVRLGEAAYTLTGSCPPFAKATLATSIRPAMQGWLAGEARLIGNEDALPADDVRACVLEVPPPPVYALITRQSERQRPSSSYYVERALAPNDATLARSASEGAAGGRVLRLSPDRLDNQSLAAAELFVVDHPGKLPAEAISALAALVRRGRGLLYVASDSTDATNLKLLTAAIGGSLRMPVEFQPPPVGTARRDLQIGSMRRQQSPFAVFGGELTPLASPLRFSGGLASRKLPAALDDDIRARLSDGSALLVVAASEGGSLAVLNADLARTNLPVSPLFVPLVAELTGELLGRRRTGGEIVSGEPFSLLVAGAADAGEGLALQGGPPDAARGELAHEALGLVWRGAAAGPPGVYEVKHQDRTIAAAAACLDAGESDLRTLEADVLENRLGGQRDVRFTAWSSDRSPVQDQLWAWLAAGCVLCIIGELAALKLFRT